MTALLSPKAAALDLEISVKTLRGHVADGSIAFIIVGRGKKRPRIAFDLPDIEAFKRERSAGPPRIEQAPPEPPAPPVDFRAYRRKHAQKVYFIRAGDTVKIGIAVDPKIRLGTLQVARPDKLELLLVLPGGAKREAKLHARFADYALSGEWFRLEGAVERFVAERLWKATQ